MLCIEAIKHVRYSIVLGKKVIDSVFKTKTGYHGIFIPLPHPPLIHDTPSGQASTFGAHLQLLRSASQ